MEPKEIDIEFTRGDTCPLKFNLLDNNKNDLELTPTDEMYFTVKKNFNTSAIIFQKKFTSGDIQKDEDGYKIILTSEDTARLNYGSYVFDLCIKSTDFVKTLAIGQLTLTNEVTFSSNE
jgi:hypothetical protein